MYVYTDAYSMYVYTDAYSMFVESAETDRLANIVFVNTIVLNRQG